MARRFYSNNAIETTLQSAIGSGDSGLVVVDSTGYPAVPFVIAVEPDTANEEFILVGAKAGTTFSTLTRAFDGSGAAAHNAGSVVKHVAVALDFTGLWTHKHAAADGHTPLDFAIAGASAPGDTASAGAAVTSARSDHRHSREIGGFHGCRLQPDATTTFDDDEAIQWNAEDFDTDDYHSNVSLITRITIPVGFGGKYLVGAGIALAETAGTSRAVHIKKNATTTILIGQFQNEAGFLPNPTASVSGIVALVEGDYIEALTENDNGSVALVLGAPYTWFEAYWLGA